jgi:hypothetical protein
MPVESKIVVVLVQLAFGIFAAALAWADVQTRNLPAPSRTEPPAEERKAA